MPEAPDATWQAEEAQGRAAPRAFWSGTLSFGLVSIPVELYVGVRPSRVALKMLSPSGHPLHRQYVCPVEGSVVPAGEIVRGYAIEPGRFVRVDDEELDAIAPEQSRDIDLTRFVDRQELDRLLLDRPYYLLPNGTSTKAYRLLAHTMQRMGRAGIASFVMRGKAYVIAIFAEQGVLQAETLRFADAVRDPDAMALPSPAATDVARAARIAQHIEGLTGDPWPSGELDDEENERLRALVQRKWAQGRDLVQAPELEPPEPDEGAPVIDIMQLLKQRLHPASDAAGDQPSDI